MAHRNAVPCGRKRHRLAAGAFALAAALAANLAAAQALSLAEAQRLAASGTPLVAAQEAAIRSAREASIAAPELADPRLTFGVENLPVDGTDRFNFTRDFMTMRKIGVMQDFVSGEKRELRGARANAEVDREVATLGVTRANLRRDVALAWIDVWAAERGLALLRDLEGQASLAESAAQATLAGGKGLAADPFSSRLASAQLVDRMIDARRSISKARAQLARWIGEDAVRTLAEPPDFTRIAHRHEDLLGGLESHPHLAIYGPMEAIADAEVRIAEAAKHPDWTLELSFAQRGPQYSNMVNIGVRIDLPIFEARRQNPAIASKLAAAEQVRAQAEDARRAHLAEIRALLADWQAAAERVQRFQSTQIPLSHERAEAALSDYRGGKSDLGIALEARRAEVEVRLASVQATAEMARAWAQIDSLLPAAPGEEHP
ncbi:MAG: TolC family protein [Usitatibacter sp.]